MEFSEISTLVGTLAGVFSAGGFGFMMYRKQNRRLKEAEAALAEQKVAAASYDGDAKRLSDLHTMFDIVNKQLIDALKSGANKDNIIEDKTSRIREKDDVIAEAAKRELILTRQLSRAERERDHYKQWMCRKPWKQCREREPEQVIKPVRYIPLEEEGLEEECLIESKINSEQS